MLAPSLFARFTKAEQSVIYTALISYGTQPRPEEIPTIDRLLADLKRTMNR